MREIVDPDKAKLIINARPYFSEETTPDSMRVGSVTKVELTQPPTAENNKPGEVAIRVTLLVGDTGYHESLITRANQEDSSERNSSEKDSSIIDMPEGTGCTKASISVTTEPGNDQYPDFSDVVAGAEIPKASSDELDEDFKKRRETVKSLMEAIGQAAAQLMLVSFSELSKGIILIVEPEKRKKPSGDSHQTITVNSPDSSAE